jgi:hypothetical protein
MDPYWAAVKTPGFNSLTDQQKAELVEAYKRRNDAEGERDRRLTRVEEQVTKLFEQQQAHTGGGGHSTRAPRS